MASFMLEDDFCPPDTHLQVWRNIIASRHYLSYRNSPYCTDMWKVLRSKMEPIHFTRNMEVHNCCIAIGSYRKIYPELQKDSATSSYSETVCASKRVPCACLGCPTVGGGCLYLYRVISECAFFRIWILAIFGQSYRMLPSSEI